MSQYVGDNSLNGNQSGLKPEDSHAGKRGSVTVKIYTSKSRADGVSYYK